MKTFHSPNHNSASLLLLCILTFVSLLSPLNPLTAQNSTEIAARFALNYFNSSIQKGKMQKAPVSLGDIQLKYQTEDKTPVPVYVYQHEQKGFVVLAESAKGFQVMGYSDKANFNPKDIPESLQQLLKIYENTEPDKLIGIQNAKETTVAVAPLLDAAGVGLNQFHHENVGGSWTGCVATAMTQIMCYYKYPNKGIGSHCYTHPSYGQVCADFGNTNYNWVNPTENDYKLLSFHVGVAMDMNYTTKGSSPKSSEYVYALDDYFGYDIEKLDYFSSDSRLIQDIIAERKPIYAQVAGDPDGHAIVLDGFDNNGFFHINFGWGGSSNGYYQLNTGSKIDIGYSNSLGTNLFEALLIRPVHISLNKTDSIALVSIKNNISNINWDLSDTRKRGGITTINGNVIGLVVHSFNGLNNEGSIPDDIGNLKNLRFLQINAKLHGTIPQTISNLTKLENLIISNSSGSLSDTIPKEIGNMTNLVNLSISKAVSGPIPASIGRLANLRNLSFYTGNIDGFIPNEICNLSNLQTLSLTDCKIKGPIPDNIGKLKELIFFNIIGNQLTGNIPSSIGELNKLTYLDLSNNNLTDRVPLTISNCTQISYLKLMNNKLEGDFPPIFENLNGFTDIDLSNNRFTGIPENIGKLGQLQTLNVSNNLLTSLPDSLNQLKALKSLWASSNKINRLPKNMNGLSNLTTIDLSNNELTYFHDDLSYLYNLTIVNLNNNKITRLPFMAAYWNVHIFSIQNNELTGYLHPNFLRQEPGNYRFDNNCFVYNDIPASSDFTYTVGAQRIVKLTKTIFKGKLGETIEIDIRKINNNLNKNDKYMWCQQPKVEQELQPQIDVEVGPVLHLVLTEKNILNKYYCVIKNDSAATYKDPDISYRIPCLKVLTTDRVSLDTLTKEEFIAQKYPDSYIVGSENVLKRELSDKNVTLISPFKMRGVKKWEGSADGKTWHELSTSMTQNDLKTNIVSVKPEELVIYPKTPAYYRCGVFESSCNPIFSDTIKVNPFGKVLLDSIINVDSSLVKVKTDSIEVTLPKGIHKGDFRLTIVKLDNPPAAPDSVKMGSVYDVTVSFGSVFDVPIQIKFKNTNKKDVKQTEIDKFVAVYFDEIKHKWIPYPVNSISLLDSSIVFFTSHLTKLGWWQMNHGTYTHILQGNRVNVLYKWNKSASESYAKYTRCANGDWYNQNTNPDADGNPYFIQDVVRLMDQVINSFERNDLRTPLLRFNVYVNTEYHGEAKTGLTTYIEPRGYFEIGTIYNRTYDRLQRTLAHEFMHYTHSLYMSALDVAISYYWLMEAIAPLGTRLVWNESELEIAEPEWYMNDQRTANNISKSIFDIISESWDNTYNIPVISKLTTETMDANLASTFLHYMSSFRNGTKLNSASIIKRQDFFRLFLDYIINRDLKSTIGDEFEEFVKYIFSGSNKKFTVLNLNEGNVFNYLLQNLGANNDGTFATSVNYNFKANELNSNNYKIKIPYLASKMLILTNQTKNKSSIVRYTKLHTTDKDNKVYYCKFNCISQRMEYVDITDSTKYSILLEANTEKAFKEYKNISFLLFVNKTCPLLDMQSDNGSSVNDFNASFELKATPVLCFSSLGYFGFSNNNFINTYDNGNKELFIISGVTYAIDYLPKLIYFQINNESSTKKLLNDATILVDVKFSYGYIVSNGPNLPNSIQEWDIEQTIKYNFVENSFDITQKNRITYKFSAYFDSNTQKSYPERLSSTVDQISKVKLKGDMDIGSGKVNEIVFTTKNSTETQKVIVPGSISDVQTETSYNSEGKVTSTKTKNYLSTDYSKNVQIYMLLHNK